MRTGGIGLILMLVLGLLDSGPRGQSADIVETIQLPASQRQGDLSLEAAHAAQNLLLQAVALELGTVPIRAVQDRAVSAVPGLSPEATPFYLVPLAIRSRYRLSSSYHLIYKSLARAALRSPASGNRPGVSDPKRAKSA
jgi:nitroreductase